MIMSTRDRAANYIDTFVTVLAENSDKLQVAFLKRLSFKSWSKF